MTKEDGIDEERRARQDRLFGAEIAGYIAQRRGADLPESIRRAIASLRWAEQIIGGDLSEVSISGDLARAWFTGDFEPIDDGPGSPDSAARAADQRGDSGAS